MSTVRRYGYGKAPVLFAEKQLHIMMRPPPCFTVGLVFLVVLGSYTQLFFLQIWLELFPEFCFCFDQSTLFQKSSDMLRDVCRGACFLAGEFSVRCWRTEKIEVHFIAYCTLWSWDVPAAFNSVPTACSFTSESVVWNLVWFTCPGTISCSSMTQFWLGCFLCVV